VYRLRLFSHGWVFGSCALRPEDERPARVPTTYLAFLRHEIPGPNLLRAAIGTKSAWPQASVGGCLLSRRCQGISRHPANGSRPPLLTRRRPWEARNQREADRSLAESLVRPAARSCNLTYLAPAAPSPACAAAPAAAASQKSRGDPGTSREAGHQRPRYPQSGSGALAPETWHDQGSSTKRCAGIGKAAKASKSPQRGIRWRRSDLMRPEQALRGGPNATGARVPSGR
jgi:hypothetical protein